jgi:hypothetical protein
MTNMLHDSDRQTMERALRDKVVPELRRLGFKGTFPDFYRDSYGFISLVNFQFYSAGGSFCINLSFTNPERTNVYFRPETETRKLRISQTRERHRLGGAGEDRWFSFGKTSYGAYRGTPIAPDELVATINELFVTEGEQWWNAKRNSQDQ